MPRLRTYLAANGALLLYATAVLLLIYYPWNLLLLCLCACRDWQRESWRHAFGSTDSCLPQRVEGTGISGQQLNALGIDIRVAGSQHFSDATGKALVQYLHAATGCKGD